MIYSGGNELLCKLFDEVGITPLESILVIGYSLKLKPDLLCYKDKFKIKPQIYTWYDERKVVEYIVVDQLKGGSIYPIEKITLEHKIELVIDDDIALQFLLEIR